MPLKGQRRGHDPPPGVAVVLSSRSIRPHLGGSRYCSHTALRVDLGAAPRVHWCDYPKQLGPSFLPAPAAPADNVVRRSPASYRWPLTQPGSDRCCDRPVLLPRRLPIYSRPGMRVLLRALPSWPAPSKRAVTNRQSGGISNPPPGLRAARGALHSLRGPPQAADATRVVAITG